MNANAKFLNEARELEGRWAKTGLLEGIGDYDVKGKFHENRYARSATAVLLENQRLINEVSTDTGDISQFKRISIPLVRRIYPKLVPNEVVGVEEMEPIKKNPDYRSIDDPWDALQDGN